MTRIKQDQSGAALLVALLILVVISLIGISAMKSSVFSAKVATSTQADAMVFEAAETALSEIYRELNAMPGGDLYTLLETDVYVQRCVTEGNARKSGACTDGDRLDSRELITASSTSSINGMRPISGSQISVTGGGTTLVDYEITMLGESEMESFGLANHHLQEALKQGIRPGSEIE